MLTPVHQSYWLPLIMMGKPSFSAKFPGNRAQNAYHASKKSRLCVQKMVFTSRWLRIGPRFGRSNCLTARRLNFRRVIPCEHLQSWTKVLGAVLQYSYFSVILGSLIKQCILFKIFLQFSLPPTLYKVKTWKKILDTRVQNRLWGEGRFWAGVN